MPSSVRRRRRDAWAVALAGFALFPLSACRNAAEPTPSRIVLVVIDMLRRDHVGAYGAELPTPNIDAIAEGGQVVRGALASYGSTRASMAALFTGRTPSLGTVNPEYGQSRGALGCGMRRFADRPDHRCLPRTLPTLAEGMQTHGYETLAVASNVHLYGDTGYSRGFDRWIEVGPRTREELAAGPRHASGAYGGTLAPAVNAAVRDLLDERRGDRFFLYVHFMDVHDHADVGLSYAEGVARVDEGVGVLIDELEARGLREDALVVLTSDHGERLGEPHAVRGMPQHYGNPTFESLLRVPLLASRKVFPESAAPIRGQDLGALLLAAAGAEAPPPADTARDELFLSEARWQGLRSERWKLMRHRQRERVLLIDLERDPNERQNFAAAHPEQVERMNERLDEIVVKLDHEPLERFPLSEAERQRLEALGYAASEEEFERLVGEAPEALR